MRKKAVVLFNLGGPNYPEEIKPFLFSLFYDKAILRLPNPFRWGVAKLISHRRFPEAHKIYQKIGGCSPLLPNTKEQAKALERQLGAGYKVFVAMRHASPRTEEAVKEVESFNPQEIILLPLYPQFSTTTTASSLQEWRRLFQSNTLQKEVCCYPTEKGLIEANGDLLRKAYQTAEAFGKPRVLLTAHGLPEKIVNQGDPYVWQVEQSAQALLAACNIPHIEARICYQSRVGPLKWVGPDTETEIKLAAQMGRPLVVLPLSFVSEHSETLVELDMEYRSLAEKEGCPAYIRVPTVSTHPLFIEALARLVTSPGAFSGCPPGYSGCYCQERKVA